MSTLGGSRSSSCQWARHHGCREAGIPGRGWSLAAVSADPTAAGETWVTLQLQHRQLRPLSKQPLKDPRSCEIPAARGLAFNERDLPSTEWSRRGEAPTGLCSSVELRILRGQREMC